MPNLAARASLSFGMTYGKDAGKRTAALRIEDDQSGLLVAEIVMDPQQLIEFLSGGNARVMMDWPEHPGRVGKQMQHEQHIIPGSAFKGLADADAAAEAWRMQFGWDTAEVRRNNKNEWVFTGRRWVAQSNEEQQ